MTNVDHVEQNVIDQFDLFYQLHGTWNCNTKQKRILKTNLLLICDFSQKHAHSAKFCNSCECFAFLHDLRGSH